MDNRTFAVLLAVALLLLGVSLSGPVAEKTPAAAMPAASVVDSGGDYRIVVESTPATRILVRQVSGVIVGGHYRIEPAASIWSASSTTPASSEAGCCCTYLPCMRR